MSLRDCFAVLSTARERRMLMDVRAKSMFDTFDARYPADPFCDLCHGSGWVPISPIDDSFGMVRPRACTCRLNEDERSS